MFWLASAERSSSAEVDVVVAGQDGAHSERLLEPRRERRREEQRQLLFGAAGRPDRAGLLAAMPGIDDHGPDGAARRLARHDGRRRRRRRRLAEDVEDQPERRPQGVGLGRAVRRELETDALRRDLDAAHQGILHLRTGRRRHDSIADQDDFVEPGAAHDPVARRLGELQHDRRHALQMDEADLDRQLALRRSRHLEHDRAASSQVKLTPSWAP